MSFFENCFTDTQQFLTHPLPETQAKGFVIPYGDCPLDGERVGEMVYIDLLNRARHSVHIITPYLILDGELETALRFAAERGVDVHLILPGVPDKQFAYALAKTHYKALLSSGVKISEWTPGFTHAKLVVMDGVEAVVGTINLDYRSLYHHFENAVWMRRVGSIRDMETDFQDTLARCRTVEATLQSVWQGKKLLRLLVCRRCGIELGLRRVALSLGVVELCLAVVKALFCRLILGELFIILLLGGVVFRLTCGDLCRSGVIFLRALTELLIALLVGHDGFGVVLFVLGAVFLRLAQIGNALIEYIDKVDYIGLLAALEAHDVRQLVRAASCRNDPEYRACGEQDAHDH